MHVLYQTIAIRELLESLRVKHHCEEINFSFLHFFNQIGNHKNLPSSVIAPEATWPLLSHTPGTYHLPPTTDQVLGLQTQIKKMGGIRPNSSKTWWR